MDQTTMRMMELSYHGYYCSQIMLLLALEAQGKSDPDLVRAMGGLANGCGHPNGTCGVLTGAACLLSLYGGKGTDDEHEDEVLRFMLSELQMWFEKQVGGRYGGTTCGAIVGDRTEIRQRCGMILAETYSYAVQVLTANGYDISRGRD